MNFKCSVRDSSEYPPFHVGIKSSTFMIEEGNYMKNLMGECCEEFAEEASSVLEEWSGRK